jgi:hypothetical protein
MAIPLMAKSVIKSKFHYSLSQFTCHKTQLALKAEQESEANGSTTRELRLSFARSLYPVKVLAHHVPSISVHRHRDIGSHELHTVGRKTAKTERRLYKHPWGSNRNSTELILTSQNVVDAPRVGRESRKRQPVTDRKQSNR